MKKIAHLNEEGRINPNTYLIDAEFFKLPKTLALYVLESGNERMLVDTGDTLSARKTLKKLKNLNLYPTQKIFFTHAHWDHIQAFHRLQKMMKDVKLDVLAHKNAVDILKNPEKMNEFFGYSVEPIFTDTILKEGDIINLNGLELEIIEFFGHTQDSIAILDRKNKNLIVGDAILDITDHETYLPVLFGPNFKEESLLKSYEKLRRMKDEIDTISFAHFGTYTGDDKDYIIENVEKMHFKAKNALIKWYKEGLSIDQITEKYQEEVVPKSQLFTKENIQGLHWNIEQNINCLKAAGLIN